MNQYIFRKIVEGNFRYSILNEHLTDDDLDKGKNKLKNNFKIQTYNWNVGKKSEWVLRHYLAVKMIMSFTVMLTSLK